MKIIYVGQTDLIREKKTGVDLNVKIMRKGNRRSDFIQKETVSFAIHIYQVAYANKCESLFKRHLIIYNYILIYKY